MYLAFYRLREKPFNLTPNPRFVYLSRSHREAFAHLLYGINNRAGFIALTGEVGSGKTTALRALLGQLDPALYRTAFIFNPCVSPPELLQAVNREFGIPANTPDGLSQLDILNQFLLRHNAEGRTVVLAIDEAQNLEGPVLEQIRLISNLETEREKLIQIVLSGQPEFAEILRRKEMRQLSQRITVRYHLQPMDFQDTADYINHRIEVAGGKGGRIFSPGALKKIYRYSGGLPRLTNVVCDRALLAGYTLDQKKIDSRIVGAGIRDMKRNMAPQGKRRRLFLIPVLGAIVLLFAAGIYFAATYAENFTAARQVQATEGGPKKFPIPGAETISNALAAELAKVPEGESARRAFNSVAGVWKAPPFPETGGQGFFEKMEEAALEKGLRLYRFSGDLEGLLRIGYPAVLEVTVPGLRGRRFLSLIGTAGERLVVDPPIRGVNSIPAGEVEKRFSGQAFLLWKDPLDVMTKLRPWSRGGPSRQLQELLREAGAYRKALTGAYDGDTFSAVKEFQLSRGIKEDGIVGAQTLMLLYASIDRFQVPKLMAGRK